MQKHQKHAEYAETLKVFGFLLTTTTKTVYKLSVLCSVKQCIDLLSRNVWDAIAFKFQAFPGQP